MVEVSDVHLRSRKQLVGIPSPQIIEMEDEDPIVEASDKPSLEPETNQVHQTTTNPNPPFPKCLAIQKHQTQAEIDLLGQLKDVSIKIPLIQAIKCIPIYTKIIRDLCLKKLGRKRKDP